MFFYVSMKSFNIYLHDKKSKLIFFLGQNHETQSQQRHTSGTQTASCDEQGAYMLIDIIQLLTSL